LPPEPTGPVTPKPMKRLDWRNDAPTTPNPPSRMPAVDVDE
jgi:hypothetical protein